MQILKGDLSNIKGISPSGLCVGVHRAGAVHHKMVAAGTTLLVSAIQNGLQLRHDCTEAVCGTDRVKLSLD